MYFFLFIFFTKNLKEISVLNQISHMDSMKELSALYLQVARAPLATRPWLWKDVFTVLPNKSVPSVSAVAAASALAKALHERHKTTPWDIFIYALHFTGVDPCQLCVCAITVLSIMGKSGGKVGLAGPNPTVTLVAGELSTSTWGAPTKAPDVSPVPSHSPGHMPGLYGRLSLHVY